MTRVPTSTLRRLMCFGFCALTRVAEEGPLLRSAGWGLENPKPFGRGDGSWAANSSSTSEGEDGVAIGAVGLAALKSASKGEDHGSRWLAADEGVGMLLVVLLSPLKDPIERADRNAGGRRLLLVLLTLLLKLSSAAAGAAGLALCDSMR